MTNILSKIEIHPGFRENTGIFPSLIVFVHCVHHGIVYHKFHHIYIHFYICENKFIKWNVICNLINYFGNVIVI